MITITKPGKKKKRKKLFLGETVFSTKEKHIITLALELMREELNRFQDKRSAYGDMIVSVEDVERLKEYIDYG